MVIQSPSLSRVLPVVAVTLLVSSTTTKDLVIKISVGECASGFDLFLSSPLLTAAGGRGASSGK